MQATEVFQEGIILRSVRLYRAGELSQDILRIVRENTRLPDGVLGDIRAQVGACRIGEQRYLEIVERFGSSRFQSACHQILLSGEQQAREALVLIPNGEYEAETCLDNDGIDLDRPLPVKVVVKVKMTISRLTWVGRRRGAGGRCMRTRTRRHRSAAWSSRC